MDPTANLTFNLKLTEQEQSAKDKLILPYMHHLDDSMKDPSSKFLLIILKKNQKINLKLQQKQVLFIMIVMMILMKRIQMMTWIFKKKRNK